MRKLMLMMVLMMAWTATGADYRHNCLDNPTDPYIQCVCGKLTEALELAEIMCEPDNLWVGDQYCAVGNHALGVYSCTPIVYCDSPDEGVTYQYEGGYHGSLCDLRPISDTTIEYDETRPLDRTGFFWEIQD